MLKPAVVYPLVLILALATGALIYAPGLGGPFLFDDHIHITQNRWVKIEQLDVDSLIQAWNSSFSNFPSSRPLAQLSFGINHALTGLDAWAFKAVNLGLHLLNGLLIYAFIRVAMRAIAGDAPSHANARFVAVAVAAIWVLHPLHVSTVLYTVQRMAQLSTLALLLALISYVWGRLQIRDGQRGCIWLLAAAPLALIGLLAKENAALLPLLLLSVELSLLAGGSAAERTRCVRAVHIAFIVVPLLVAVAYVATHPGLLSYDRRTFTLDERLLTQPRVLWTYVQWLALPNVSAFGLFHDDLTISRDWLNPLTTLPALIALIAVSVAAWIVRRRSPVIAFGVFFFLANHALESSVFPLEMMFEHRNYLASIGPIFVLAYLVGVGATRLKLRVLAASIALLAASYAYVTAMRVDNWSSYRNFVFATAENHPASRRANFMAAQLLISSIAQHDGDTTALEQAAIHYLDTGLAIDEGCIDCLFAKVILSLQLGRQPAQADIDLLRSMLRDGDVGPTQVSVSQFSFLARWQRSDGEKLDTPVFESLFDAALANPGWNDTGRAGLAAAYREYHEYVSGDLATAERLARKSVSVWPTQWGYHVHLVRVLQKQRKFADALDALRHATTSLRNARQRAEHAALTQTVEDQLQNFKNGID